LYKQIRTIYNIHETGSGTCNHPHFQFEKLTPCKKFSWLLNWHLAIFLAPTFWEPKQPLCMHVQTCFSVQNISHKFTLMLESDMTYRFVNREWCSNISININIFLINFYQSSYTLKFCHCYLNSLYKYKGCQGWSFHC
jgi:hypothetical protein